MWSDSSFLDIIYWKKFQYFYRARDGLHATWKFVFKIHCDWLQLPLHCYHSLSVWTRHWWSHLLHHMIREQWYKHRTDLRVQGTDLKPCLSLQLCSPNKIKCYSLHAKTCCLRLSCSWTTIFILTIILRFYIDLSHYLSFSVIGFKFYRFYRLYRIMR